MRPSGKETATGTPLTTASRPMTIEESTMMAPTDRTMPAGRIISGWAMPVGRTTSSRHLWETAWTSIFSTLTQSKPQRIDRLRVSSGGTDAYVLCQQDRYDPRAADICAWTPRLLTSQMVAALCDWSHRVGYRELRFVVGSESLKALGTEAEADAYTQDTYALKG